MPITNKNASIGAYRPELRGEALELRGEASMDEARCTQKRPLLDLRKPLFQVDAVGLPETASPVRHEGLDEQKRELL